MIIRHPGRLCVSALTLFLTMLGATAPVRAQFNTPQYTNIYSGRTFNNPMSATLDLYIMQGMQRRMMYRSMLRKKGYSDERLGKMSEEEMKKALGLSSGNKKTSTPTKASAPERRIAPESPALPVRFKPTGTRLLLDKFVNTLGTTDEEKKAYRTIFTEFLKAYETEAAKAGHANDVAGALTCFVGLNYQIYHPGEMVSDAATEALLHQFQSVFNNDDFRKSTDRSKQEAYETFLLMGAYLYTLSEVAKQQNEQSVKDAASKLGGEGLRFVLKVEPARVRLTNTGLELAPE